MRDEGQEEDRRDTRRPGRRQEDALVRDAVRLLLVEEGYLNRDQLDLRYQRLRDAADLRGWMLVLLTAANLAAIFAR